MMTFTHRLFCLALAAASLVPGPQLAAQSSYQPGLVSNITRTDGSIARRVDAVCDAKWTEPRQYDERLGSDQDVKIRWNGELNVKAEGKYQLAVQCLGDCQLRLDGQSVVAVRSDKTELRKSSEQTLTFGYHKLEVVYEGRQTAGQIQLFWRGPGFQWEPINERFLVHENNDHPSDDFERGQLLARGLRCVACHQSAELALAPVSLKAPDLSRLQGNLQPNWLIDWLTEPKSPPTTSAELRDDEVGRRMPHFGLSTQDASDIAQALLDASKDFDAFKPSRDYEKKADKSKSKDKKEARTKPDAQEGRKLVLTRGCMACHALSSEGVALRDEDDEANYSVEARRDYFTYQVFGGGELSGIAAKRPADFFARWLAKPESINASHRMPEANLTDLEREDISLYLASLKNESDSTRTNTKGDATRGAELINRHRCAACHNLPDKLDAKPIKKTNLDAQSRWDAGCLQSAQADKALPGFELTAAQRQSLRVYWTSLAKSANTNPATSSPQMLMAESNCFGCHARHNHIGLVPRAMQIIDKERELAARLPAMLPPSLNGVGDKLHDAALASAIARSESPHRPWLDIRMPKYPFDPHQIESLVAALIDSDRMPTIDETKKEPLADDIVTRAAAGRLVTSEGFGCQSCHQIGTQPSPTVALGARGTDLTMLGKRIRQSWFDRWVRNPIRIVPRMEMPAIQLPVHGVLGNDINRQIDAVWDMLNTPEFQPPSPAPVRVVRKHNLPGQVEPAHVLTDVLETSERNYLRPLIVGFQNRHNVLLDLERGELAKWWIGDTARELTRGKSWYWELGGQPLGAKLESLARFELIDPAGQRWQPRAIEQFVIEFDELEHTASGVNVKARMHFIHREQRITVPVTIAMEPKSGKDFSFVDLAFHFAAPANYRLVVYAGDVKGVWKESEAGHWVVIDSHSTISFPGWSKQYSDAKDDGLQISAAAPNDPIVCTLRLWTDWPVDQFAEAVNNIDTASNPTPPAAAAQSPATRNRAVAINVVPGFDGLQLPLPRSEMPTALAWHQGQLAIGSLKGRVCLARDTDNDGLADTWEPISDDVPAPYGIASSGQSIDVLAKYGLIRLTPPSADGAPWNMQVLADGWGYTADYHDWAVGLVRDTKNNYLMALPCQQDDRSLSAARLRGTVQRLIPQTPTSTDPRSYRLETVAAGQRFPMGLAIDTRERLFATDNQGNYNPFNEVNHIQDGKRYGFINKLENKPGFNPPLESPAVNLPHPWTRSVNGICFLNTPETAKTRPLFGPYEGHLIGCEYNGLSLIRMSMEEVDGVVQGAAYMFSRPVQEGEPTFEGPVVCAVSPDGELVVGNIHDSGWGGGQNTGSIVQLKPTGHWRMGIAEVKALPDGLRVHFTGPVNETAASAPSTYSVRSYRRVSTPAYGGNDQEERQETVLAAKVFADGTTVDLTLGNLRADTVYELRVGKIANEPLFPDEAHYTMKKVPKSSQ